MEETVKIISDLVGTIGVPGALLIFGVWKLAPPLTRMLEGVTASLTEIKNTLGEMKDEMRDLNSRLTPRTT